MRGRRGGLALTGAALLVAACVHYPSVMDIGGTRITTENGRAARAGDGLDVYFDVRSTGKFGDAIVGVVAPIARQAALVDAGGAPVKRIDIPGAITVRFAPGGTHVALTGLTRPLVTGETVIVTLMFEKSGGVGIVTLIE